MQFLSLPRNSRRMDSGENWFVRDFFRKYRPRIFRFRKITLSSRLHDSIVSSFFFLEIIDNFASRILFEGIARILENEKREIREALDSFFLAHERRGIARKLGWCIGGISESVRRSSFSQESAVISRRKIVKRVDEGTRCALFSNSWQHFAIPGYTSIPLCFRCSNIDVVSSCNGIYVLSRKRIPRLSSYKVIFFNTVLELNIH